MATNHIQYAPKRRDCSDAIELRLILFYSENALVNPLQTVNVSLKSQLQGNLSELPVDILYRSNRCVLQPHWQ